MRRFFASFVDGVVLVARIGAGLAFAVLLATVILQVIGRSQGSSPVWTEELTRYALLFMVALGAGLAFRTGDLVNVDVISEMMPDRISWGLRLFSAVATAGLAAFLLPHAWRYVSIGKLQTSPALGVRMDAIHFSVWLMLALLALFGLIRVIGMLTGSETGRPTLQDED